ncbi:sensor histidine kinase [Galbibacter sp. PAP.153]|uniref:sensor histidine kinase n=1 Tax=Galbibacter sp. PAP.153 TaxID=3104623 RepID=UPI00300B60F6
MAQKYNSISSRLDEKMHLILYVNYFSSALMICIALVCYFILDIKHIVPQVLLGYSVLSLLNIFLLKYHKKLLVTYLISLNLGVIGSIIVTVVTGGINSPFIFTMPLIVFAGYISTRNYGQFHMYLILLFILLIYFRNEIHLNFPNVVPEKSKDDFSLMSVLFSLYLLGGIFGKVLLGNYNKLYQSKKEIEKKSNENEVLLKEIHHRVKNNLQTISSLLNMQARTTENEDTKKILTSSHNRVLSMAIVHEMLYARDDLSKIEYRDYVKQLVKFHIKSLNKEDKKINFKINISNIKYNIETAIPLGLLISEFITNSLKHAFVNKDEGAITVTIEKTDPEFYTLILSDNGIGYNTSVAENKTKSMGLKLIHNLTRQLRGNLEKIDKSQGVTYLIRFKEI